MSCKICGKSDLFSGVTGEPACSVCKIKYIGGLPTTQERIDKARTALGLKRGEFLQQDYGNECRAILGRRPL
jgi:hypothetical protein